MLWFTFQSGSCSIQSTLHVAPWSDSYVVDVVERNISALVHKLSDATLTHKNFPSPSTCDVDYLDTVDNVWVYIR